ncbi:MAG: MurR/RpiR family transcriptional regulator [Saccharospirillum sp.]
MIDTSTSRPPISDLVSLLKERKSSLSKVDGRLIDLILSDIDYAIHASTTELAEKAGTSTPSVTRFCRKLGFKNLRDFKIQLAQARSVGARFLIGQVSPGSHSETSEQVIRRAQQALEMQLALLDSDAIEGAVQAIKAASRIIAFGSGGGSTIVAQDAEHRMFRLGLPVNAYQDIQLLQMVASTLKAGDVLLIISTSGRLPSLVEACEIAQSYGAIVIGITRPASLLSRHVDILLPVDIPEEKEFVNQPTSSRYALLSIIDILSSDLAVAIGTSALENVRRIRHSLVRYRGDDDNEPLGD